MTPRQRLRSLLETQEPEIGVSFWRHFYAEEFELASYVQAMCRFWERFQWDLLKLNPRSTYHNEVWGVRYRPSGHPYIKPVFEFTPIQTLADWTRVIQPVAPDTGPLGEQLEAIRRIRTNLGPDVPLLQTVFSPLEIASRFLPRKWDLAALIRMEPNLFREVFATLTEVFTQFALAALEAGADGLFFATTWGTFQTPTEIFEVYERAYDLELLEKVRPHANLIILHICGDNTRVMEMLDYPVDMLHWNWVGGNNPTYHEVELIQERVIVGGILGRGLLRYGPEYRIYDYIERAIRPRRWLVSAECTYPPETPEAHLLAVRRAVADQRGETFTEPTPEVP